MKHNIKKYDTKKLVKNLSNNSKVSFTNEHSSNLLFRFLVQIECF